MKAKKLFCLGMALVIICFNLTQIPIHAQGITNEKMEYEDGIQTGEVVYAESRSTDENGFEIENGVLVGYSGTDTEIVIPDSVTEIGDNVFWFCRNLTSITIPESVTKIGRQAFGYCIGLTNITIPESVTEIVEAAF